MAETKINKVTKSTTAVGGTTNLQWITKSQAIYTGPTGGGGGTTGDGSGEVAEVNGETLEFKASSSGTDIVLNSNEEATRVLTNIKQGNTVYSIPQGGSGGSSSSIYLHSIIMQVTTTNNKLYVVYLSIYTDNDAIIDNINTFIMILSKFGMAIVTGYGIDNNTAKTQFIVNLCMVNDNNVTFGGYDVETYEISGYALADTDVITIYDKVAKIGG